VADGLAVLGISASSQAGTVTVARIVVRLSGSASVELESLESWRTAARDEDRTMVDLADALSNVLDRKRPGAPVALAVKRPENVGRPTIQYDQKTRVEGAAMIAAAGQGRRYFGFRRSQLGVGRQYAEAAAQAAAYPSDTVGRDAVAAASAALAKLVDEGETDD
jgi:hypothetical protein